MKEVELKILGINKSSLTRKLRFLGAKKVFGPNILTEIYFTDNSQNLSFTALRLRKGRGKSELTLKFKPRNGGSKFLVREELETEVGDFESTKAILEKLGYTAFRKREKKREEYLYKGIKIEIDQYPLIPCFVEIESKKGAGIIRLIKDLGLNNHKTSNATATEIIKMYGKDPDNLEF